MNAYSGFSIPFHLIDFTKYYYYYYYYILSPNKYPWDTTSSQKILGQGIRGFNSALIQC